MIETEMASRKMIGAEEKLLDSLLIEERWRRRDVIGRLRHLLERPGNPLSLYHRSVVQTDKRNWEKICRRNTRNRTHSGRNVMVTIAQHFAGENIKKMFKFYFSPVPLEFQDDDQQFRFDLICRYSVVVVVRNFSRWARKSSTSSRMDINIRLNIIHTTPWQHPSSTHNRRRRKYVRKESYWRFCWIENIFLYIEHII
jgi:hypothetical protein